MLGTQGLELWNTETLYYLKSYTPTLILASFLATPAAKKIYGFIASKEAGSIALSALKPICYIAILIVCTAGIIDGSFNPFIYFRF
jgi:alginate O-acetyltransferase complex protein AlgI